MQDTNNNASTFLNQQAFPLLRLPAELRNKIYDYALRIEVFRIYFDAAGHLGCELPLRHHFRRFTLNPGLPRTCRQLAEECGPFFFKVNTFEIWLRNLENLGACLPKKVRQRVRVLRIKAVSNSGFERDLRELRKFPKLKKIVLAELEPGMRPGREELLKSRVEQLAGMDVHVVKGIY